MAFEAQLSAIESSNGQTVVELVSDPLAPAAASSPSTTDSVPEDIMDRIRDEIEIIDQFLRPPATPLEDPFDDDELEAELDALAAEAEDVTYTSPAATRPAATHRRPTPRQWQNLPTQDELDELAALEEAMAM